MGYMLYIQQFTLIPFVLYNLHRTLMFPGVQFLLICLTNQWHLQPGYSLRTFTGHSASVMSLDFHPNKEELICSCNGDGEIRSWSINKCSCAWVFKVKNMGWGIWFNIFNYPLLLSFLENWCMLVNVLIDLAFCVEIRVARLRWDFNPVMEDFLLPQQRMWYPYWMLRHKHVGIITGWLLLAHIM